MKERCLTMNNEMIIQKKNVFSAIIFCFSGLFNLIALAFNQLKRSGAILALEASEKIGNGYALITPNMEDFSEFSKFFLIINAILYIATISSSIMLFIIGVVKAVSVIKFNFNSDEKTDKMGSTTIKTNASGAAVMFIFMLAVCMLNSIDIGLASQKVSLDFGAYVFVVGTIVAWVVYIVVMKNCFPKAKTSSNKTARDTTTNDYGGPYSNGIPKYDVKSNMEAEGASHSILCSVCGRRVDPNSKFCSFCGGATASSPTSKCCPVCGGIVRENEKFCSACGCSLDEESSKSFCLKCGKIGKKEDRFCSFCGGAVVAITKISPICSKCGKTADRDDKFCAVCGGAITYFTGNYNCSECGKIAKQGAKFCTACGGKVVATTIDSSCIERYRNELKNEAKRKAEEESRRLAEEEEIIKKEMEERKQEEKAKKEEEERLIIDEELAKMFEDHKEFSDEEDNRNRVLLKRDQEPDFSITLNNRAKSFEHYVIDDDILRKSHKDITLSSIPEGIIIIGLRAFSCRYYLMKVVFSSSVEKILKEAFWNCKNLRFIHFNNSIEYIGQEAFCMCESLEEVTIPDSVTYLGKGVFKYCSSLTKVTIPEGIEKINDEMFYGCRKLAEVKIPQSVRIIGKEAFADCWAFENIEIPEGVTEIGEDAFRGCVNAISVTLPSSVVNFGKNAFDKCFRLKSVYASKDLVIPSGVFNRGVSIIRK